MRWQVRTWAQVTALLAAFLLVALGLAWGAETCVKAAHLAVLYGVEPVASGRVYFTVTKPELIVSNGDRLPRFHLWCHTLALASLWLGSCGAVYCGAQALGRRAGLLRE